MIIESTVNSTVKIPPVKIISLITVSSDDSENNCLMSLEKRCCTVRHPSGHHGVGIAGLMPAFVSILGDSHRDDDRIKEL